MKRINELKKVFVIGDSGVQKTESMILLFREDIPEYVPTVLECFEYKTKFGNKEVSININDIPTDEEYDHHYIRYYEADIVIFMFAINKRSSLQYLYDNFLFDIKRFFITFPKSKFILCGSTVHGYPKEEIDEDEKYGNDWIKRSEAIALMKSIGAIEYIEIDIESKKNIKYLYDSAVYYSCF